MNKINNVRNKTVEAIRSATDIKSFNLDLLSIYIHEIMDEVEHDELLYVMNQELSQRVGAGFPKFRSIEALEDHLKGVA